MASTKFLDVMLGFIGFTSTVCTLIWLCLSLVPLFEEVKQSCRAGLECSNRPLLLWGFALTFATWLASGVFYLYTLFTLWDLMALWLNDALHGRAMYELLDICFLFLIVCGGLGIAYSAQFVYQRLYIIGDINMIIRFHAERYRPVEDLEGQNTAYLPEVQEVAQQEDFAGPQLTRELIPSQHDSDSDVQTTLLEDHRDASTDDDWPGMGHPVGQIIKQTIWGSPKTYRRAKAAAMGFVQTSHGQASSCCSSVDSDGDLIVPTPSDSSSAASSNTLHDGERPPSPDIRRFNINRNPDDLNALYDAPPRTAIADGDEDEELDADYLDLGPPISPCSSCASTYIGSLPSTTVALTREPLTPTSPGIGPQDPKQPDVSCQESQKPKPQPRQSVRLPPLISSARQSTLGYPALYGRVTPRVLFGVGPAVNHSSTRKKFGLSKKNDPSPLTTAKTRWAEQSHSHAREPRQVCCTTTAAAAASSPPHRKTCPSTPIPTLRITPGGNASQDAAQTEPGPLDVAGLADDADAEADSPGLGARSRRGCAKLRSRHEAWGSRDSNGVPSLGTVSGGSHSLSPRRGSASIVEWVVDREDRSRQRRLHLSLQIPGNPRVGARGGVEG